MKKNKDNVNIIDGKKWTGGGLKYSLNSITKRILVLSLALCVSLTGVVLAYAGIYIPDENNFVFAGYGAGEAVIPKAGKYLIEVSGDPSSSTGGRLSCYMTLKVGDKLKSTIYKGGTVGSKGSATGIKGGDAVAISVNGTIITGAGGGGGAGAHFTNKLNYNYPTGVSEIDNSKFGAGGGGGAFHDYQGGSHGGKGEPSTGGAGGIEARPGVSGSNYLNTSLATLIEENNASHHISYRVVPYPEKSMNIRPDMIYDGEVPMGNLTVISQSVSSSDDASQFEATLPLATYTITLKGGRSGGSVTADMMLKKGDKLSAYQIGVGAKSLGGNIPGGNMIYVCYTDAFTKDRKMIAGAGGGSYSGDKGGQSTLYYDNGVYGETVGTAGYMGLSSGASSNHSTAYVSGTDILKGVWGTGAPNGQGSANYIDREFFSTYTSTANAGTGQIQGSITITLKSIATKDQITVVELQRDIAEIKASLSAIKVPESAPVITVVDGQAFEMRLNQYDDMDPAVQDGISIANQAKDDGFIQISGQLSGKGYKDIVIGGKKFTFNVIEAPTAANVKVTFD